MSAPDGSLAGLGALARHHWSWISESFLHVSILEEWGEQTLSGRITAQYSSEIPRAFRLIELLLESKSRIDLGFRDPRLESCLLEPGRSVRTMAARELSMMRVFDARLETLSREYSRDGREDVAGILDEAIASRNEYRIWLVEWLESLTEADQRLCLIPDDPAWLPLNRLLLQLLDAIDETSIHMLVLGNANQVEKAEQSWQRSYEYMLLAVEIVRYLASRDWAIDFRNRAVLEEIDSPRIGATASQAQQINQWRESSLKRSVGAVAGSDSSGRNGSPEDSGAGAFLREIARRIGALPDPAPGSGPAMRSIMERYRYSR